MTTTSDATGPVIRRLKPPLAILIAVSAIGPLALNLFIPSMPGLQRVFGVDYAAVQLTLTLYIIGLAVSQLFYGPLSDRFGRRPVLLAGLGLFVVASLLCAVAPTIEVLIAGRLVQAVGGCSGIVLGRAIVRDLYDRDKSASVIGYITMAWVVAPMVAPLIGGLLDVHFGWRSGFLALALIGGLVLLCSLRWLHETHVTRAAQGLASFFGSFGRLLRHRQFLGYSLQLTFTSMVFFSFLAGAPYVMVEVLGRSPVEYGVYFMLVSLGYMTGNGLSGRFSQRLGIDRMIGLGTQVALLGVIIMTGLALAGLLHPVSIFLPMLLVALGNGLSLPNGTVGAISVMPAMTGAAAGLAGFLQMGGGSLSSQSVGLLQNGAGLAMFYVMLCGAILAILAHRLVARRG